MSSDKMDDLRLRWSFWKIKFWKLENVWIAARKKKKISKFEKIISRFEKDIEDNKLRITEESDKLKRYYSVDEVPDE